MGGKMSRNKGSAAERAVRDILRAYGIEANRTPASGALHWHQILRGDVSGWDGFHVEVKRQERLQLDAWSKQAEHDAGDNEIPLVVYRRSREPWRVSLRFDDFLNLVIDASEADSSVPVEE